MSKNWFQTAHSVTDEVREQELSGATSVSIPCDFHTHIRMCLVPPHMLSKTHLQQSNKCSAYDSPYVTEGMIGQRRVFSTTQLLCLEILSWAHCLTLESVKAFAPCSSRFLRKVPLDDTWARVSCFRGNGERIGKERWAPLNTSEKADRARQSILHELQVGCGESGHTILKSQICGCNKAWESLHFPLRGS